MLGKLGDVISILPCLQQEFKETGIKPTLIVAKEYAALPLALPWLSVEVLELSFELIEEAIKWGKRTGTIDFIPQMSGINHKPVRKHPSFQFDQWSRMGRLHQWRELTLELPRKLNSSPFRGDDCILFADHSQSSPFPHAEDLFQSLQKAFPRHHVQRLSTLRLPTLLHFLHLMDAASLIVTIDTSFLHLSRAVKTPVIALVTDQPSTWHGSGYHPRFALHVRYADYELRKSELLFTAKEILKLY